MVLYNSRDNLLSLIKSRNRSRPDLTPEEHHIMHVVWGRNNITKKDFKFPLVQDRRQSNGQDGLWNQTNKAYQVTQNAGFYQRSSGNRWRYNLSDFCLIIGPILERKQPRMKKIGKIMRIRKNYYENCHLMLTQINKFQDN